MSAVADELLGGAMRTRTRVRGFAPWTPRGATLELLEQVRLVLGEYEAYLPLAIRQIFYRLVGKYEYEKTERAYARLCEALNRARRARIISFDDIRDDGTTIIAPACWPSANSFIANVHYRADHLMLDRTRGQKTRLVVNCEAAGMAPQLARITKPLGVKVISSGGFESTTERHNFAAELVDHDCPTEVLDIGDHDASGAHKYLAFLEDIEAFARQLGGEVRFTRLAVTPRQIEDLGLPTAPPKESDRRAFNGETCQAEAIAPDVLAQILHDALDARIDHRVFNRILRQEQQERRELQKWLRGCRR
jgi:hypothetical protein